MHADPCPGPRYRPLNACPDGLVRQYETQATTEASRSRRPEILMPERSLSLHAYPVYRTSLSKLKKNPRFRARYSPWVPQTSVADKIASSSSLEAEDSSAEHHRRHIIGKSRAHAKSDIHRISRVVIKGSPTCEPMQCTGTHQGPLNTKSNISNLGHSSHPNGVATVTATRGPRLIRHAIALHIQAGLLIALFSNNHNIR
jgi:hypothetical protein